MTCFTFASLYWILLILNFPRNAHLSNVAARTIELVLSHPHVFVTYFLSLCEGFEKEVENQLFFLPPSFTGVCADTAAELRLFTHSNYQRCICQRVHCVAPSFAILIVFFSGK